MLPHCLRQLQLKAIVALRPATRGGGAIVTDETAVSGIEFPSVGWVGDSSRHSTRHRNDVEIRSWSNRAFGEITPKMSDQRGTEISARASTWRKRAVILNGVQVDRVSNRGECLTQAVIGGDGGRAEHLRRGDAREDPQDEDDHDYFDQCESGAFHLIATARAALWFSAGLANSS